MVYFCCLLSTTHTRYGMNLVYLHYCPYKQFLEGLKIKPGAYLYTGSLYFPAYIWTEFCIKNTTIDKNQMLIGTLRPCVTTDESYISQCFYLSTCMLLLLLPSSSVVLCNFKLCMSCVSVCELILSVLEWFEYCSE